MSSKLECPSPEALSDFVLGKLSDDRSKPLALHVKDCPECQARIDTDVDSSDTFVRKLRQTPPDDAFLREPQCGQAVAESQTLARELLSMGQHLAVAQGEAMARDLAAEDSEFGENASRDSSSADGGLGYLRDYKLLRKIGQGGMGTVYEALHTHLDRHVAVKVLPQEKMQNPQAVARFKREMQAVGKLVHPNIVQAHDAGEADGKHYLVMEYVEGLDLSTLVRRIGPVPVADACELTRQAALGLQYAHDNGLVHRDIKPSNLMVTPDGTVKLLDLGLALLSESLPEGGELTMEGQVMGTLDYMAPEQLGDAHGVTQQADLYSLGATLYKLLSGRAPYADKKYDTPTKKLVAIATRPVVPIQQCRDDIPPTLSAALDRMLAKNPDGRYATATEVAEAMVPMCSGSDLKSLVSQAVTQTDEDEPNASFKESTIDPVASAQTDTRPSLEKPMAEPVRATEPAWRRFITRRSIAVLVLFAIVGLLSIYYVTTNKGTLVVTVDDENIEVKLADGGLIVRDLTTDRTYRVKLGPNKLSPGNYELMVSDDVGLDIVTEKFMLTRGGHAAVTVNRAASRPESAPSDDGKPDSPPVRPPPGPDSVEPPEDQSEGDQNRTGTSALQPEPGGPFAGDRKAAMWVLENGGNVRLWAPGNRDLRVESPGRLPNVPFRLLGLELWNLRSAKAEDFRILRGLTELQSVGLGSPGQLLGDAVLANLVDSVKITSLDLPGAGVTASGLLHLKSHPDLRTLWLYDNPIRDEDLSTISRLSELTELNIHGSSVTDRGVIDHIGQLLKLEVLSLGSTLLTDEGIKGLVHLSQLTNLDVATTGITDEGVRTIADSLPLEIIDLRSTFVTDEGLKHLARVQTLRVVSVESNPQIADTGMGYLAKLTGLRRLEVSGTSVTDYGVESICAIEGLESLNLSGTAITDESIPFLVQLRKLDDLNLAGTSITESGVGRLASLSTLQQLGLSGTSVTDTMIEHLSKLTALRNLVIGNTRITKDGYDRLRQLLPDCQIDWEPPSE